MEFGSQDLDPEKLNIKNPDFNPEKLNINELKRILNEYDVDLPTKQQLKSFYIQMVLDNLPKMIKIKNKRDLIYANTPVKNPVLREQQSVKSSSKKKPTSVKTKVKNRGISDLTNSPLHINADHDQIDGNPFDSNFSPKGIVHFDSLAEVDVNFSNKGPIEFQESASNLDNAGSPLRRNVKSPLKKMSSDRVIPKSRELEMHKILMERNKKRNRRRLLAKVFSVLFAVSLAILGHYMATDNANLAYCNGKNVEMIYPFTPSCIECPPNAICEKRQVKECVADFKLKSSFLSFLLPDQLIPFPFNQPSCVYDPSEQISEAKKTKQLDHLVEVVDVIVREFMGNVECNPSKYRKDMKWIFAARLPLKAIGMPISVLKENLQRMIANQWEAAQFDEYWALLMDRILVGKAGPLNTVIDELQQQHRFIVSTNPPIISYSCLLKNAVWSAAVKYSKYLLVAGISIVVILYVLMARTQRQYESQIVATLVEEIIHSIHSEAINYHQDSIKHAYPGIPISQLKDHFLPRSLSQNKESDVDAHGRTIFYVSDHVRKRIWIRIRTEVLKNSSVRETNAQIKGEAHLVWMWIGSSVLTPLKKRKSELMNTPTFEKMPETPTK